MCCLPVSRPPARVVHHRGDAELLAHGQVFGLDGARQQVVHGLRNVGLAVAFFSRDPERLHDLPAGEVGTGGIAHFAGAYGLVHGFEGLFERHRPIGEVEVVEVEVIGLEALQCVVESLQERCAGEAAFIGAGAHFAGGFTGQHYAVAAAFEDLAEHGFRHTGLVHVGGVEEVDAMVEAGVHQAGGCGQVAGLAQGHGAKGGAGDGQIGVQEGALFHETDSLSIITPQARAAARFPIDIL